LEPNECIIITGAERYSTYTGYASTFKFGGDYKDETPRDSLGRRKTVILAIDASIFKVPSRQFSPKSITRELNKAYCGFYTREFKDMPIATGHWGCGAFGGNKQLKSIIQIMAASEVGRDIHYFTFGDEQFASSLSTLVALLKGKNVTVGALMVVLVSEYNELQQSSTEADLFKYLTARFS